MTLSADTLLTIGLAAMVGAGILIVALTASRGDGFDLTKRLAEFDETGDEILSARESELRKPLSQRVLIPAANRIGETLSQRLGTADFMTLDRQLRQAGFSDSLTPGGFLALRIVLGVAGLIIGGLLGTYLGFSEMLVILVSIGLGFAGMILPKSRLESRLRKRRASILRAMPAALDLLTICVQGGLSFDAALQEVASKYHNELSTELNTMLNEVRLGRPRRDAMRAFEERCAIPEVTGFVDAIIQSEQLGSPMADALQVQSEEIRRRRRQRAEELGQKAPIKMLLPLVGCVFPTIFVILLGPAALTIVRQVMGAK